MRIISEYLINYSSGFERLLKVLQTDSGYYVEKWNKGNVHYEKLSEEECTKYDLK